MTSETEDRGSENNDTFPSKLNNVGINGHTRNSDETKRRVSISQDAIQADNDKKSRKVSSISSRSNTSIKSNASTDNASNGYVNPAFQNYPPGMRITAES